MQHGKGNKPNAIARSSSEDYVNGPFIVESYKHKPSLQYDVISSSLTTFYVGT